MSSSSGTGSLSLAKGGPTTQEGKEVVKWNAIQHGIRSPTPVVPGVEKKERETLASAAKQPKPEPEWEPETPELRARTLGVEQSEVISRLPTLPT